MRATRHSFLLREPRVTFATPTRASSSLRIVWTTERREFKADDASRRWTTRKCEDNDGRALLTNGQPERRTQLQLCTLGETAQSNSKLFLRAEVTALRGGGKKNWKETSLLPRFSSNASERSFASARCTVNTRRVASITLRTSTSASHGLRTYLPTYQPTHLPTYLPTYLPT